RVVACRRVLLPLHLWRRKAILHCQPARRQRTVDCGRLALENFRHDRLAHGLCACAAAAHRGHDQAAEPVHLESTFDCAVCGDRGAARNDGFCRRHAGRICAAARKDFSRRARNSRSHLHGAAGRILYFPKCLRASDERHARQHRDRAATARARACGRGSRRRVRRARASAAFLRDLDGANRRGIAAAHALLRPSNVILCPARLEPIFSPRPWGSLSLAPFFPQQSNLAEPLGEAWMTGNECRFANGPFERTLLGDAWPEMPPEWIGTLARGYDRIPILVKFIFTEQKLSVQVHPDDAYAAAHEKAAGGRGKTEMWYALRARPGAEVMVGLRPGATKEKFQRAVQDGTAEDWLEHVHLQAGDAVFVPAG